MLFDRCLARHFSILRVRGIYGTIPREVILDGPEGLQDNGNIILSDFAGLSPGIGQMFIGHVIFFTELSILA